MNPIPVFRPSLDADAVWRELRPVIDSGWLGMGPKVEELEANNLSTAREFNRTPQWDYYCSAEMRLLLG